MENNVNNNEVHNFCSIHEQTVNLISVISEENKRQNLWLNQLFTKDREMENRIILIESNIDKIKKYGFYVGTFFLGSILNSESLKTIIELIDKFSN